MATQTPNKPPAGGAGKKAGNILTRKLGPAPVWVWGAVVIGLYLAYRYYENNKANSAAATDTTSATDPSALTDPASAGGSASGTSTGSTPDNSGTPYDPYSTLYTQLTSNVPGTNGSPTLAQISDPNDPAGSGISGASLIKAPDQQSGGGSDSGVTNPTSNAAGSQTANIGDWSGGTGSGGVGAKAVPNAPGFYNIKGTTSGVTVK